MGVNYLPYISGMKLQEDILYNPHLHIEVLGIESRSLKLTREYCMDNGDYLSAGNYTHRLIQNELTISALKTHLEVLVEILDYKFEDSINYN